MHLKDLSRTRQKVQFSAFGSHSQSYDGRLTIVLAGRIARELLKSSPTSNAAAQARSNRRNHAKQSQIKKRNSLISSTRIFNGVDGAPRIVAVIPLTGDVSTRNVIASLAESLELLAEDCPEDGIWKMR